MIKFNSFSIVNGQLMSGKCIKCISSLNVLVILIAFVDQGISPCHSDQMSLWLLNALLLCFELPSVHTDSEDNSIGDLVTQSLTNFVNSTRPNFVA